MRMMKMMMISRRRMMTRCKNSLSVFAFNGADWRWNSTFLTRSSSAFLRRKKYEGGVNIQKACYYENYVAKT